MRRPSQQIVSSDFKYHQRVVLIRRQPNKHRDIPKKNARPLMNLPDHESGPIRHSQGFLIRQRTSELPQEPTDRNLPFTAPPLSDAARVKQIGLSVTQHESNCTRAVPLVNEQEPIISIPHRVEFLKIVRVHGEFVIWAAKVAVASEWNMPEAASP